MSNEKDTSNERNSNPDNEFNNSMPHEPEIPQPGPSTATPPIPQEIPIR